MGRYLIVLLISMTLGTSCAPSGSGGEQEDTVSAAPARDPSAEESERLRQELEAVTAYAEAMANRLELTATALHEITSREMAVRVSLTAGELLGPGYRDLDVQIAEDLSFIEQRLADARRIIEEARNTSIDSHLALRFEAVVKRLQDLLDTKDREIEKLRLMIEELKEERQELLSMNREQDARIEEAEEELIAQDEVIRDLDAHIDILRHEAALAFIVIAKGRMLRELHRQGVLERRNFRYFAVRLDELSRARYSDIATRVDRTTSEFELRSVGDLRIVSLHKMMPGIHLRPLGNGVTVLTLDEPASVWAMHGALIFKESE